MRGVVRTTSELVRERTQARRQVRQDMRPRVHRGWDFAGERGALNGVMRDFNTRHGRRGPAPRERAASTSTTSTTTRSPTTPASCGPSRSTRSWASTPCSASSRRWPPRPSATTASWCSPTTGSRRARCSPTGTARACPSSCRGLAGTTVAGTEVNTEGSARVDVLTDEQPALVAQALRAGSDDTIEQAEAEESAAQAAMTASSAAGDRGGRRPGAAVARLRLRQPRPGLRQRRGPPAHPGRDRGAVAGPAAGAGRARGRVVRRRGHRGRPGRHRPERRAPAP